VVVGADAHKRCHTLVAMDEVGRKVGEKVVQAIPDGHLEALAWTERWPDRRRALEDCRHVTCRLEADLLRAGKAVVRVPTRLMSQDRKAVREAGKRLRNAARPGCPGERSRRLVGFGDQTAVRLRPRPK
jgi:hypothetical protein